MAQTPIILIVDDNPTNLNVLFEYLEESGFEVSVAQSGKSAFEQFDQINPDLVLLDIMMPGIDGLEICRRLKKNPATADIPVIFMTALTDPVDKIKGFLAGGSDYITKPLQHEEVLARITAHLKLRQAEQQMRHLQKQLEETHRQNEERARELSELKACKQMFFSYIDSSLQTPLNALLGCARLMIEHSDRYSKEQMKNELLQLQTFAERLQAQHDNLVMWAKLQRGELECAAGLLNVEELIVYNVIFFTPFANQKHIALQSAIQSPVLAYADYDMLNTILRNLLSNALKYTDAGGKINISAVEKGERVELLIADTGIGMTSEQAQALLRNHPRCADTPHGKPPVGIGFMLCTALVERCGGSLRIESMPAKGTTVVVSLPKQAR